MITGQRTTPAVFADTEPWLWLYYRRQLDRKIAERDRETLGSPLWHSADARVIHARRVLARLVGGR